MPSHSLYPAIPQRAAELLHKLGNHPVPEALFPLVSFVRQLTNLQPLDDYLPFFQQFVDATHHAIIFTDAERNIIWANSAFLTISGYSLEEMRGKSPGLLVQGEDTDPNTIKAIRDALSAQQYFRTEILNYTRDGEPYWIDLEIVPVHAPDLSLIGFIAIQTDVTSRKHAEAELQRSAEMFSKIFANNAAVLALSDLRYGRFVAVNPAFTQILGFTEEEVIGQTSFELGITKSIQERHNFIASLKSMEPSAPRELTVFTKSGEPLVFEFRGDLVEVGDTQMLLTVANNITPRKQQDAALREASARAEAAAREARESEYAQRQLLATMSHEMRTPLNAITGMASLLLQSPLNEEQTEFTQTIASSSDNLLQLINNILDFSKLKFGAVQIESLPFQLDNLLADCLRTVAHAAASKCIGLHLHVPANTPAVLISDAHRLGQCLTNLLANAVKFTNSGAVQLHARLEDPDAPQPLLQIDVIDSGIGIPAQQLPLLFQPFHQADASTSRRFGGTGLGLAITKMLMDALGGTISAASTVDQGSTFSLRLPVRVSDHRFRVFSRSHLLDLPECAVLSIAQDPLLDQLLAAFCANNRIFFDRCDDLDSALFRARRHQADVVLIDQCACHEHVHSPIFDLLQQPDVPPNIHGICFTSILTSQRPSTPKARSLRLPLLPDSFANALRDLLAAPQPVPLIPVAIPEPDCADAAASQPEPDAQPSHLNILIVDDSSVNRKVLNAILRKLPHTLQSAENGKVAVDLATANFFDLILMDIQMPIMDGIAATKAILNHYQFSPRKPNIIAVTAAIMPGDREDSLDAGMVDFIPKPVTPAALLKACRKFGA